MQKQCTEIGVWHKTREDVNWCQWVRFSTWKTSGGNFAYRALEGDGVNEEGNGPSYWWLPKPRYKNTEKKRRQAIRRLAEKYLDYQQ